MLCPFKFGAYKFEGGEECQPECALLMAVDYAPDTMLMCAIALIAAGVDADCPIGAVNVMEADDGSQEDE